ncbi:MAG: hypothetical protein DMF54_03285 [Acidobacteria bacterium]|nr:MAG: hypothetical protein DMF54_03285 [Acidobacteriota bacterium]
MQLRFGQGARPAFQQDLEQAEGLRMKVNRLSAAKELPGFRVERAVVEADSHGGFRRKPEENQLSPKTPSEETTIVIIRQPNDGKKEMT